MLFNKKNIGIICLGLMVGWGVRAEIVQPDTRKSGTYRRAHSLYRALTADVDSMAQRYANFKQKLAHDTGLSYSLDISILGQRAAPNGKGTPWQTQYYGSANWDMFHSDIWGAGSAQIAYTAIRYWGTNAQRVNNRIGVISSFNDYTTNANYFDQLSYTHQLPGAWDGLSVTLGQFPIYTFDGTAYDSNQQINFLNYALSQNGSSVYPSAGLGGYATWTPNSAVSITAGFQGASNISGDRISAHSFGKGKYTGFGSLTWTPTWTSVGQSTISFLYYYQPSVADQPQASNGWSVNVQQNLGDKWAVFARLNGTDKSAQSVRQSYALGVVWNNPMNRNALDQIGVAGAVNKLNKAVNGTGTRSVENVLEAYWAFGVSNFMTLTPDIQFYINPGADTRRHTATAASVRATLVF